MNQSTSSPRVFFTVIFLMGALQTAYARTSSGTITHSALAVIITCPSDITVSCASQVPSDESNFIVATSNCPGLVTVVLVGDVITNQICPDNYIITRTYQATDLCGNSATCIQIIT